MKESTDHRVYDSEPVPSSPVRLSDIVEELAKNAENSITVRQIREALDDRSFATLLLFFALINMLPLPPGTTLVLGLPLILISIQMVSGRTSVWLPEFLLVKSIKADQFRRLCAKLLPRLRQLEAFVRPRYWPFTSSKTAERIVGIAALMLAILVTLPIPFGNWFPALACACLGLGLSERDGILLVVAGLSAVVSLVLIAALFGTAGIMANIYFS